MKGEAFVKMPRDLLESEAWRSLSINARRFIDILMLEHLRHAGRDNGRLLAPWRQLEAAGIGARYIGDAIDEAATRGLVVVKHGRARRPNIYGLTWLPLFDGTTLGRPWLSTRPAIPSEGKALDAVMPSEGKATAFRREGITGPNAFPSDSSRREGTSKNHDLTTAGVTTLVLLSNGVDALPEPLKPNGPSNHRAGKPGRASQVRVPA
jgi:hypothetical protein